VVGSEDEMAGRDDPFANVRARRLVRRFESLTTFLPITPNAQRVVETYFYSNYGKFALQNNEERLLAHWENAFDIFESQLRLLSRSGRIDAAEMAFAIRESAARSRLRDPDLLEEKIPPPVF
jgi:hypothetical protein